MAHRYFEALHKNLEEQYKPCDCPACQSLQVELAQKEDENPLFKKILKTAEKAFKKLFDKGSYKPEDLFKVKEYKTLINETTKTFNSVISHEVTDDLRKHLEYGNLVFSGLKTHAQLTEARSLLKDENGNIRPYHQFERDILKLNQTYNKNYLEAEYEFAVQSAQSVENWQSFSDNTKRYLLEYRTAGDERVRADHDALRGICLPKDDPFWQSYYPPLGWRCRCVAVQVLASEKQLSDSQKAQELGEQATTQIGKTGKNKLEMFRFNPALDKTLFPKKNGYSKVVGAPIVLTIINNKFNKTETWEVVKTEKGKVRVSSFHGKNEKQENIEIASHFANKYSHEIDLLGKSHTQKTADVLNKTLGIEQEYKRIEKKTKSAVDNALRSAKDQADNIVLDIKSEISNGDLRDVISSRVTRSKNIKTITIIKDGNDKTYKREDILKDDWTL